MNVEQAIFASVRSAGGSGYQLAARSAGILDSDAQELTVWGPSHDSLWDAAATTPSVNFFPLPSGAVCVSKTTSAGAEYSSRGGLHVYTRCFVLERDQLARFANNPFAVLKALTAQGSAEVIDRPPAMLPTISLLGRASVVDVDALTQAGRTLGAAPLANLVQAALTTPQLGVMSDHDPRRVLAALVNCLPAECRGEFSLATGLRYSPQRPFRLCGCPAHSADARRLERVYGLEVFDPALQRDDAAIDHGWAQLIMYVLDQGRAMDLRQALTMPHPGLTCDQLDELGRDLLTLFERQPGPARPSAAATEERVRPTSVPSQRGGFRVVGSGDPLSDEVNRRADGQHVKFEQTAKAQEKVRAAAERVKLADLATDPSDVLSAARPRAQAQLELLDDTVFDAIAGKSEAMRRLETLWPEVLRELGPELVEESQVQYLRHALAMWRNYSDDEAGGDPQKAGRALEVLCLLLDDRTGVTS